MCILPPFSQCCSSSHNVQRRWRLMCCCQQHKHAPCRWKSCRKPQGLMLLPCGAGTSRAAVVFPQTQHSLPAAVVFFSFPLVSTLNIATRLPCLCCLFVCFFHFSGFFFLVFFLIYLLRQKSAKNVMVNTETWESDSKFCAYFFWKSQCAPVYSSIQTTGKMIPPLSKPPNHINILVLFFVCIRKTHQNYFSSFKGFSYINRKLEQKNLHFCKYKFLSVFCLTASFSNENIDLISCANQS